MAWGSSSAGDVDRLGSYAAAHRHWQETKPVRSYRWDAVTQRPLGARDKTQYRLERSRSGPDTAPDYYDAVLYRTVIVRYYRPMEDGRYKVDINGYGTPVTSAFAWRVNNHHDCGINKETCSVTGEPVFWGAWGGHMPGSDFGAELVYNADGKIICAESRIPRTYKRIMSTEQKEKRKQLRAALEKYVLLASLKDSSLSMTTSGMYRRHAVCECLLTGVELPEAEVAALIESAAYSFRYYRANNEDPDNAKAITYVTTALVNEIWNEGNKQRVYDPLWAEPATQKFFVSADEK